MTTTAPIIDPYYVPERAQVSRAPNPRKLIKGLLISFVIHLIGLSIVVTFTRLHNTIPEVQNKAPISATLVYPRITPPLPEPDKNKPAPPAPSNSKADAQPAPDAPIPDTKISVTETETNTALDPIHTEPETAPPLPSVNEPPPTDAPENDAPEVETVMPTSNANQANRQAGRLNLSPRASASQFFQQREQQVIAEEGLRAAKEFRRKKNSPDLIDPRKDDEETVVEERPVKRVNCSGTTNKTLATLSGWAGGTLKCSKGSDYERFIEARVAKKTNEK